MGRASYFCEIPLEFDLIAAAGASRAFSAEMKPRNRQLQSSFR